eukprot:GHRR01006769.1.p1 GENE.GHRR01006769.1~~GHRR01006769.1.p1  ORF type:complete len:491 (+),score=142.61 GHRR01006769.1:191-1663(+)
MLRARQKHTCGLESVCAVATAVAVLVCLGTLTLPPVVAQQQSNESTLAASNTSSNTTAGSGGSCCEQIQSLRFSSNIPVMVIQLSGTRQVAGATAADLQLQTKGPYLPATMCTCGAGADDVESIAAEIKVRGSSSARDYAKKSFAVNTLDQITSFGQSKKKDYPLLGLPSDSDWVLYGPENDRTLGMRNWLAYGLARQMGRYASRTRYMELFLNTEDGAPLSLRHYWGVYQLQETASRGKDRINIQTYDATTDPSGGYILEYENDNIDGAKDVAFATKLTRLMFIIAYPKEANSAAVMWIQKWMNDFESQLLAKPTSELSSILDIPAAIDYFLGTEVTKNPDGYRGSIKMHKDSGGPLVMGPLWDYNEAFGMCCGYPIEGYQADGRSNGSSGGSAISAAGWRFNICQDPGRCKVEPLDGISQWYRKMWQDASYRTATAARWKELRAAGGPLADSYFTGEIANLKELLTDAGQRNWQRWGVSWWYLECMRV